MREIKFKCYSKQGKCNFIFDLHSLVFFYEDDIIMQYTGLKDKNGKEIYEGDKIFDSFSQVNRTVQWSDEYAGFAVTDCNIDNDFEGDEMELNNHNAKYHYEVIGNIHENPELLEQL